MGILGAMVFVRYGLEPLVKSLRTVFKASGAWEKSSEYHFLREVQTSCTCAPCVGMPTRAAGSKSVNHEPAPLDIVAGHRARNEAVVPV